MKEKEVKIIILKEELEKNRQCRKQKKTKTLSQQM